MIKKMTLDQLKDLTENGVVEVRSFQVVEEKSGEILYEEGAENLEYALEQVNAIFQPLSRGGRALTLEEMIQLYEFTRRLPSEEVTAQAVTMQQKELANYFRGLAWLVAGCLFVRLSHADGDPIRDLLHCKTPEQQSLHTITWTMADGFETLYKLVQLLWEPIQLELSSLKDAPASSYELIQKLIQEHFDYCYELSLLEDETISNPREKEAVATTFKTLFLTPELLKPKQKKILEKQRKNTNRLFWLGTVLDIAEKDIKLYRNQAAKNLLCRYRYNVGILFNQTGSFYRKARKEGGFKKCTEASKVC